MLFRLLLSMICVLGLTGAEVKGESEVLAPQELEAYYALLNEQVEKQEQVVQGLLKRAQSGKPVPMQIQRTEFEQAIVMLDVKKNLYANFYETQSVKQSKLVRDTLLKLLQQQNITTADLGALQNLVKSEKERLDIK